MRWNLILLAAGYSKRFGGRKLLAEINGIPLYRFSLKKMKKLSETLDSADILVVTSYSEIEDFCKKSGITVLKNEGAENTGIASSIRKAVEYLERNDRVSGNRESFDVFFTADQPGLDEKETEIFLRQYVLQEKRIGTLECGDVWRSPNVFDAYYRKELLQLSREKGGKVVMRQHKEDVFAYHTDREEQFLDIDTREDLLRISDKLFS